MARNDKKYAFLIKIGTSGVKNHKIGFYSTNITWEGLQIHKN
jgi:hypothetical protein